MKGKIGLILLFVLSISMGGMGGNVFAQEEVPFLENLQQQLKQRQWTGEEVGELIQAAKAFQWEGTNPEHAEVVAMALQYSLRTDENLMGQERARLALELALGAQEMEQMGFQRREIARTSLECTREMIREMEQLRERDENLPEGNPPMEPNELAVQLRERARSRIEEQIRNETPAQVRQRSEDVEGGPQNGGGPETGKPANAPGRR